MVGDDGETAAGTEHLERLPEQVAQGTGLVVDLDAQCLKHLGEFFLFLSWVDKRLYDREKLLDGVDRRFVARVDYGLGDAS